MKALLMSDLHLEFQPFVPPVTDVDIVILAGDIDKGVRGVRWAGETFDAPVLYVPGNHEFYSGHIDYTLDKIRAASASHVHVLDRDRFFLEGRRFLGATSWTDYASTGDVSAAMGMARNWMNDFKVIRADARYRKLRPDDLVTRNRLAKDWLSTQLNLSHIGNTIVITHHAPLLSTVDSEHEGHLSASYANNWPSLVCSSDVWIFGHTHYAVDIEIGGCRLLSNPRGYPNEITGFDPYKVIEI